MFSTVVTMVLCPVDNFLRMFYSHTQSKGLSFDQNILTVQHFKNIPGRMSGRQYHGISFPYFAIRSFYPLDLTEFDNQLHHFGVKMNFTSGVLYRFTNSCDNARQFIGADMRPCIYQNIFRGTMSYKYFQHLVYITTLGRPRIEFTIRISSCTAFTKTIIRFRVYQSLFIDISQITATLFYILATFQYNRFQPQLNTL